MAKSINVFKNMNSTNSVYTDDTKITNLKFVNGKITAKCTGMTAAKKIMNFDHACRIIGVAFNASYGVSGHAFSIYKGTSAASHLLAKVRPVASNVKCEATVLDPSNAVIAAGNYLTLTVSGASWATAPVGYLEIDTIPV